MALHRTVERTYVRHGPLVRAYKGERTFRVSIGGVNRDLPIVEISPHLWIASNAELILGDVEFLSKAARVLSDRVKRTRAEVIVTAEAKSIALAYALSVALAHPRFVVARKTVKAYMGDHLSQPVKSITTTSAQELILTQDEVDLIKGKRVCILDDVVSTGGTLAALDALVRKSGGMVACRAALWKEGPWNNDRDLVYVGSLPVFVDEEHPLWAETWKGSSRRGKRRDGARRSQGFISRHRT